MSYPSPPWTIQGYGFLTGHLLDVDRVRSVIPSDVQIISILPGKTIGGILIASYGEGSVMPYNELIVVSGLVASGKQLGFWISHIYVDNPDSVAGGREIWGLPKELARFEWNLAGQPAVQVWQDDRRLCSLTCTGRSLLLPLPTLPASVISRLATDGLTFSVQATLNPQLAGIQLDIPATSPFAALNLGQAWIATYNDRLAAIINHPVKLPTST